jgi:diaminopimelate decarboxylase
LDRCFIPVYIDTLFTAGVLTVNEHSEERGGRAIGGVQISELIAEFGSPLYAYDARIIRERVRELKEAIVYPHREIKYACKANTNVEIIRIMAKEGLGIDAVSPGEIFAARTAGIPPGKILFTVNNATEEDVTYAVESGVMVNVDSLTQLESFGRRYPGRDICVRINPNVGAGHHDHCITGGPQSKFGIRYSEAGTVRKVSREHGLQVRGIHQHIGSGILQADKFIEAMEVLLDTASLFAEDLSFIDFGGGIGIPYHEDEDPIDVGALGRQISEEFSRFCARYASNRRGNGKESLKLVIEPGRYLVAEAGFLIARVTSVKQGERYRFVGCDTGFNHLIRPAMYGSYHPITNGTNPGGQPLAQVIAGNLCESGDTFTRNEEGIQERILPEFRVGDLVCIGHAGAYGFSMASNYNSRPRPAEVMVEDGKPRIIRNRESVEDLFRTGLRGIVG